MKWCACMLALLFSLAVQAQERILSFHSDIKIGARGELSVTETIEAQVEGREIKRGILRDFPTEYRDRLGWRVSVPFDLIEAKRDGHREFRRATISCRKIHRTNITSQG